MSDDLETSLFVESNGVTYRYHADKWSSTFVPPFVYSEYGSSPTEALPQMDASGKRSRYHPDNWLSVFGRPPPVAHGSALPMVEIEAGRARRSLYNANGWTGAGFEIFAVPAADPVFLILGTPTNGYGVEQDAFGNAHVVKYVSGTKTYLATIALPNDNNYHTFKLSIVPGTNNQIEASIDGTKFAIQTDNSLTLTTGTWPISMSGGAEGGARHFHARMSVGHHIAQSAQVQAAIQAIADTHGSYVTHGTIYQEHIVGMTGTGSVNLDGMPDGTTYSRVKGTELFLGQVTRLNDGTNIRTAAMVAGAIDSSSRLVGNLYDGTRTRLVSDVTQTVNSGGGIDFSSSLHINKTLDNIADGIMYARVHASELSSGLVYRLNDGTNIRTAATIAAAIDSSSRVLNVPWAAGVVLNTDGSYSGFSSSGSPTSAALTIGVGHVITVEGQFELSATGNQQQLFLGNATNGYGFTWNVGGTININRYSGGVKTTLGSLTTVTQDTLVHSYEITLTCVSTSSVTIEVAWDNQTPFLYNDTSGALNLTSGTWPFTFYDGSNGGTKLWNFDFDSTQPTYTSLASQVRGAIDSSGNILLSPFGNTSGIKQLASNNALTGFSSSGNKAVQVYPLGAYPVQISADIQLAATGQTAGLYIEDPFGNLVGLEWLSSGTLRTVQYISGTPTVLETFVASPAQDTNSHSFLITVTWNSGSSQANIAAQFDVATSPNNGLGANTTGGAFSTFSPNVNAGGTSGQVQNLAVSYLSRMNKGVNLAGVTLDAIPDGSTYERVNATNLNSNNINTPWNSSSVYIGSDGSVTGFPGSAVPTGAAYPLVAGYMLTAAAWMKAASTSGTVEFLIGNQTNGLGVRWTSAGALSLVTYKAGTATAGTTLATITRDTNYHWLSVKLTPGTTPGTSDAYVLFFDKNTVSSTTGTAAVTWGSTVNATFQGGSVAGSSLLGFQLTSNNP